MHVKISKEESAQRWMGLGLPESSANFMAFLEDACADGMEEKLTDEVEMVTGRPPQKFDEWLQHNKTKWQ